MRRAILSVALVLGCALSRICSATPVTNHVGLAAGIASLPCTPSRENVTYTILNASSVTDCDSTGGGAIKAECKCQGGTWTGVAGSGGAVLCSDLPALIGDVTSVAGSCATTVALIDPALISGLIVWLDPGQEAFADNDAVGTAANFGSGPDFTQATADKKPTFKTGIVSSLPVFRFDGGDCLASASTVGLSTFDVFAVFRATAIGMLYEHSADVNSNDGSFLYLNSAASPIATRRTTTSSKNTSSINWGSTDNTWHVVHQAFGGDHNVHKFWLDGAFPPQVTALSGPATSTSTVTTTLYVGCRGDASEFFTGDLAALLIYTPHISSSDADKLKLQLRYQFGL